jgi:hypothetical protein
MVSNAADLPLENVDNVIEHLTRLSFLGVETSPDVFSFSEEIKEYKKNKVLAGKFSAAIGVEKRFEINRAFRAYLEIRD